jgi:hypothetical protein
MRQAAAAAAAAPPLDGRALAVARAAKAMAPGAFALKYMSPQGPDAEPWPEKMSKGSLPRAQAGGQAPQPG